MKGRTAGTIYRLNYNIFDAYRARLFHFWKDFCFWRIGLRREQLLPSFTVKN